MNTIYVSVNKNRIWVALRAQLTDFALQSLSLFKCRKQHLLGAIGRCWRARGRSRSKCKYLSVCRIRLLQLRGWSVACQEFFADYFAVNTDLFTLNLRHCLSPRSDHWREKLNRMCDGIISCCLSMRLKPLVRFARSSDVTMQIAQELTVRAIAILIIIGLV